MRAYLNAFPHVVQLSSQPGDTPDDWVKSAHAAAAWLKKEKIPESRYSMDMNFGHGPTQFSFKRAKEALMFKLIWG